jgi:hypothetical protein
VSVAKPEAPQYAGAMSCWGVGVWATQELRTELCWETLGNDTELFTGLSWLKVTSRHRLSDGSNQISTLLKALGFKLLSNCQLPHRRTAPWNY